MRTTLQPQLMRGSAMIERAISKTLSGAVIDLLEPDYSGVTIKDIALGLSRESRFNGQTIGGFYSVGLHCIIGSIIAPDHIKYAFLMHDASEAVLKDIPRDLKRLLPEYQRIEALHDAAIAKAFNVPTEFRDEVKHIDMVMADAELFVFRGWAYNDLPTKGPELDWAISLLQNYVGLDMTQVYEWFWIFGRILRNEIRAMARGQNKRQHAARIGSGANCQ